MADMLHESPDKSRSSRDVSSPASAWIRTWVSRFSIPPQARRQDVAFDLDLSLEGPDQCRGCRLDRDELRHRPAVLGDHDALGTHLVEDGETFLLELCGAHRLHGRGEYTWSQIMSSR